MLKVLLVNPLVSKKAPFKRTVSLGLGYLASYIRDFCEVRIIDMDFQGLSDEQVCEIAMDYDAVCFTGMTYQGKSGWKLAKIIKAKKKSIITIFGGVFYSFMIKETLRKPGCDFVIYGEGEGPLRQLLLSIGDKKDFSSIPGLAWKKGKEIIVNRPAEPLDINSLPFPARDLIPSNGVIFDGVFENRKSMMAMFSRGCPGTCIFCSTPKMWGQKVRIRSIDLIIQEINHCIREFSLKNFAFDDDTFTWNRDFVIEFCDRLISEKIDIKWRVNTKVHLIDEAMLQKMKEAGCVKTTFGVESGDPEILSRIGKGFTIAQIKRAFDLSKKAELPASMLMIIGHPGETQETIKKSIDLVTECQPNGGYDFQVMQPHPGTKLRDSVAGEFGRIISKDWDDYFSDDITYLPSGFTLHEFYRLCREMTMREIRVAGNKKIAAFSAQKGNQICIPPVPWEESCFDLWAPFYWRTGNFGLTYTLGRDIGYITFLFRFDGRACSGLVVKARIASHSKQIEIPEKRFSDITLLINDIEVGTNTVDFEWPTCILQEWHISSDILKSIQLKKGINRLTFQIKQGATNKNGLTIYYKAISAEFKPLEMPIQIELLE